jgi:hypothetical protein
MRSLRLLSLLLPLTLATGCVVAAETQPVYGYGYGSGYGYGYSAPPVYRPAPAYRPYYAPPRAWYPPPRAWSGPARGYYGPPRHHGGPPPGRWRRW